MCDKHHCLQRNAEQVSNWVNKYFFYEMFVFSPINTMPGGTNKPTLSVVF